MLVPACGGPFAQINAPEAGRIGGGFVVLYFATGSLHTPSTLNFCLWSALDGTFGGTFNCGGGERGFGCVYSARCGGGTMVL